ncbi:hypothetical protein SDC9_149712 [bioreactor metagenome]|uniref:Uncharacterized protein n=1 Tax=bioreactor metagenome TaxID=1076179 RepID=A0A645EM28_9ZZZZ
MLVTFKLGPESSPSGYLNLDDVTNNSVSNSDIVLQVITGTKSTDYDLYVTNRARYTLTDKKDLDLSSCLKFFPLSGFTHTDYLIQALMFVSGDSYCVLTNEGRIAIVSFVKDSINFNDDGTLDISIKVSTYKPQYLSLLDATAETTPTLTRTLYMTPTLCVNNWQSEVEARYDSTGISACLAREIENTMHAFVTAVKNGDKEAITTLVEYPVLMANNENDVWASNKEEFLAGYNLIFTPEIVARLSRAKMDDVMGGDFLTGVYWPVRDGADGYVTFTPKGKIQVISFYGIK